MLAINVHDFNIGFEMNAILTFMLISFVYGGPATESYKDQYCTDPRTMKKHAAYTEWADAYSCTRHRCQPGGRNLAIYTVGCKRVEAPESAIECEEVVEDTNMQFPYCCTRLRCLVVVRGEVWTRVLGQPWEILPAAPWSHMYKMKKPPPGDTKFLSKTPEQGPIYELAEPEKQNPREKVLRAGKKDFTEAPDYNEAVPRAVPAPDIVIALSTNNDNKEHKKKEHSRHKRVRKTAQTSGAFMDEEHTQELAEGDETPSATERSSEPNSDERFRGNVFGVTQRVPKVQHHQIAWTEIPPGEWHERETPTDTETVKVSQAQDSEKKDEKPSNLQALVDAIGTRMRDIENVVQRMSEKVHHDKPTDTDVASAEKKSSTETNSHHKDNKEMGKAKKPSPDSENYKRFSVRNRGGSKYVHVTTDTSTEQPLFVEDNNMNGYYSDASNSVLRRASPPKEPATIYMAPVESRRKTPAHILVSDSSDEGDKKRKKHTHKRKRGKGHTHKKHHKDDKRKHSNRLTSVEVDKNAVSLEDSSAVVRK